MFFGNKLSTARLQPSPSCSVVVAALIALGATSAWGGNVAVKGTHLCCGGCQAGAEEALADVPGVTKVSADLNTKAIAFQADDEKAAVAGINALAAAGFYGQATHGGKPLKFPPSGAKKGMRANALVLEGLHLCCSACVTGSQKSLVDVKGISLIDIDRNEKTIKLTGSAINVVEAIAALNKAGFYCRLPKPRQ